MRLLITGVSAVGKSSVLAALESVGYAVVDLEDDWCIPQSDGTRLWDESAVDRLLTTGPEHLAVAGCEANMGVFVPRFDHVVLLTTTQSELMRRLQERSQVDLVRQHGGTAEERRRILRDRREVEPLLRELCTVEIDSSGDLDHTVAAVLAAVGLAPSAIQQSAPR